MLFLKNNKGIVIIASLWIMIILSLLALSIAFRASIGLKLVGYYKDDIQAGLITKAAIERFIGLIKDNVNVFDNPDFFKDVKINNSTYSVIVKEDSEKQELIYGASDEQGKLNINSLFVKKRVLLNLPFLNSHYADLLIDYRNGKTETKLDEIEELALIDGIDLKTLKQIEENFTVYGDGSLNINTADKQVLIALGLSSNLADKIIIYRNGLDGKKLTNDDRYFNNKDLNSFFESKIKLNDIEKTSFSRIRNFLTTKTKCYRLNILAKTGKVNKWTTVVLDIPSEDTYKIRYWYES